MAAICWSKANILSHQCSCQVKLNQLPFSKVHHNHQPRPKLVRPGTSSFLGHAITFSRSLSLSKSRGTAIPVKCAAEASSFKDEDSPPAFDDAGSTETAGTSAVNARATLILAWRALKLPIYSVCLIPLVVGAATAFHATGAFSAPMFGRLLAAGMLVITWLNLSNDGHDADTSVDATKKESVVNLIRNQRLVLLVAYACLAAGLALIAMSGSVARDPRVLRYLLGAIACGYVYQCPPFRLSYQGLGEPLCFASFGPLATSAFYLSQVPATSVLFSGAIPATAWAASAVVGMTTMLILFCSHFHQAEGDFRAGKMSPSVRLGPTRAASLVPYMVSFTFFIIWAAVGMRVLPLTVLMSTALAIPSAGKLLHFVSTTKETPEKMFRAKYFCVIWHTIMGICLAAGLAVSKSFMLP